MWIKGLIKDMPQALLFKKAAQNPVDYFGF